MRIVGLDGPQSDDFHVSKSGDDLQEQDMYFSLPPTATECSLNWSVPEEAERNFTVSGSGYVRVFVVDRAGNVGKHVGGADFRYWDDDASASNHLSANIDCTTEPIFRVTPDQDGEIFIDQNDHTGWYIQYKC
jgi:hypothetical protein